MPSQHKYPPIGFRPPAALRERLTAHAAETGRPVGAIVTAAVDAYLPGGTPPPDGELPPPGGELPPALPPAPVDRLIVNPHIAAALERDGQVRGRDFVVSEPVPAPPKPRKKRQAAPVAAELAPQDTCPHPAIRVHKGMCGACGTGGLR
jgi:hypothetical protein